MPMKVDNARLLLVQESISFHRPDKFVSISNLHLQEEEFVKNICNKIKALNPDLILVSIFQPTTFDSFLSAMSLPRTSKDLNSSFLLHLNKITPKS